MPDKVVKVKHQIKAVTVSNLTMRGKSTQKRRNSHIPKGTQGVSEQAVQIIIMVVVGQETQELHQELHLF